MPDTDAADELRQHLVLRHRVHPDRMPPDAALETFHTDIHALTNPSASHDSQGTPDALAGAASRAFDLLAAALLDLDAVDRGAAVETAEQMGNRLIGRFPP